MAEMKEAKNIRKSNLEKKDKQRYKRIATGIATSAAVVTIGASMIMAPVTSAHSLDQGNMQRHSSTQRKAPAWRVGLKAAEAKALNMTTEQFKEARKDKKLSEIIADKGMTIDQFKQKVKDELVASWKADGVSDKDIEARLAKLNKFQERQEQRMERRQR
jgi:hypothetical protein